MKAAATQIKDTVLPRPPKQHRNKITELSDYLAVREEQRQSLVHSLKGKFSPMKFSSNDLIKQRRAEATLEGY